jgi:ABC-type Fe2+-enterobactin transport system substrate-binding protein
MATTAKVTNKVVGINTSKISSLQKSISSYIGYVKKQTDISATAKEIQVAIKGSASEASLKTLATQLNTNLVNYLKYLDQFSTQLGTITSTYKKADASNTTFSTATSQLKK